MEFLPVCDVMCGRSNSCIEFVQLRDGFYTFDLSICLTGWLANMRTKGVKIFRAHAQMKFNSQLACSVFMQLSHICKG